MSLIARSIVSAWLILCVSAMSLSAADTPTVRTSIMRAMPYVISEGNSWIETKDCTSCHRTSFQTWAMTAASEVGVEIDQTELENLRVWSRENLNELNEKEMKPAAALNLECVSQILWAERKLFSPRNDQESRSTFLQYLRDGQLETGLWKANGQLPFQRRPAEETQLVSTMWNALALGTSPDLASQEARRKAMIPIEQSTLGSSTEELMLRVLLAIQAHNSEQAEKWVTELKSRQRDDGSWNWATNTESDPMATGMTIYALRAAKVPTSDSTIQKAIDFLISKQAENGSWDTTPGTKKKANGKPVETSIYWGTCWSVIGLSATLTENPI